jgi:hypothetical protein
MTTRSTGINYSPKYPGVLKFFFNKNQQPKTSVDLFQKIKFQDVLHQIIISIKFAII